MTDKELRKLRRDDLLQILIDQQKQIDALKAELQLSKEALNNRDMAIQESGTLAEAALKMNGVFDAAQSAADEYVAQIRKKADEMAAEAEKKAEEARKQAENVVRNARSEAEHILSQARSEASDLARQAQAAASPQPPASAGEAGEADGDEEGKRRRWHLWGNKQA